MFKTRFSFKNIIQSTNNVNIVFTKKLSNASLPHKLNFNKVLLLSKLTIYECERNRYKSLTDEQFEKELRRNGKDFDRLSYFYHLHKDFETKVIYNLKDAGIDVKVVNRTNYTNDLVKWADVIMPTGGDGTFLLAASKVNDNRKPVIGFNSDPTRSEGHLCLPKRYSENISEAIEMLQNNNFSWLLRTRIRIKLTGMTSPIIPTHLHLCDKNFDYQPNIDTPQIKGKSTQILPYLTLNEVFIGECLSARVSYLEVTLNDNVHPTNMKCSGMCISTGTGSTSWHLSMNRVSSESVESLLSLIKSDLPDDIHEMAEALSGDYNKKLIFEPDDTRIIYTIRDLISAGVWPQPKGIKRRDFCSKLIIKCKCVDAYIVIDGGIAIKITNGSILDLQTHPEDALRTVVLPD